MAEPKRKTSVEKGSASSGTRKKSARKYDLSKPKDLVELIRDEEQEVIKHYVTNHVKGIITKYEFDNYEPILLLDDCDNISSYHSNTIYESASKVRSDANIFLIISSDGGKIEPAYLISKTCKRLAKEKFIVAVPRRAKSAATLIALGADEIHMGIMSELGPIDPQIGGYPALALSNALNRVADLACRFPNSSDMFAAYLTRNLALNDLGYFERVTESAAQYAERLLADKNLPGGNTSESLADHFVNHYKDHNFVIDMDEAKGLLGNDVIKEETKEYNCANEVFSFLNFFKFALDLIITSEYYYVGSVENGLTIRRKG